MSTHRAGPVTLTYSDTAWRRLLERAREQLAERVQAVLRRHRDEVLDDARRAFPRRTGASARSLDAVDEVRDGRVVVGIESPVPYIDEIKGDPWRALVVVPGERRQPEIVRELEREIGDLLRGG